MDDLTIWLQQQLENQRFRAEALQKLAPTFAPEIATILNETAELLLADVDAKRRILADYERYAAERRRAMNGWESSREISPILAALALPYAGRPGYRDEWRPEVTDGQ